MKTNDSRPERRGSRSFLVIVTGSVLLGLLPMMILLWLAGSSWRGIAILAFVTAAFAFAIGVRVRRPVRVQKRKWLSFIRVLEVSVAALLLLIAYLLQWKTFAAWSMLCIILLDRFVHLLFRESRLGGNG